MEAEITKLEIPSGAGRATRNYFSGATALAEKQETPITVALRTYAQLNPKAFVDYLLEQGIVTEETARELLGSR